MKSREWWKFEPDYLNTVVTSGKGSGAGYKAAARASDGRTVMVWFPDASQATVDLSKISGQRAKAYSWNPNDNTSTLIGIYATTGSQTVTPSSDGMVLVIDDEAAGFAAPGQLGTSGGGGGGNSSGGGSGGGGSGNSSGGGGGGCFVQTVMQACIANMYFSPVGIFLKNWAGLATPAGMDPNLLSWGDFLWNNLLPVTIGNVLGGGVFVGMSYWGAYLRPLNEPRSKSA